MNLVGERGRRLRLLVEAVPVRYSRNGRVNPAWLSACKEERNLTSHLMDRIADPLNVSKAFKVVLSNGGSCGANGRLVSFAGCVSWVLRNGYAGKLL
jgi:hypothetical protein